MVDVMNRNLVWIIIIASSFGYSSAWAQDDAGGDEAETTIRLMGAAEAELPDAVTKEIALPALFSEDSVAVEKAQAGMDTANENRQRREAGLATADEASQSGAELAEDARENRENRGRSEDNVPDGTPGPPDNPGPPGGQ
jgi:hypothetical protein